MSKEDQQKDNTLVMVLNAAVQLPGVKVDRDSFLMGQFRNVPREQRNIILENGPVKAGRSEKELRQKAIRLVNERTMASTGASFLAGLPGGAAIAATVPADIAQFYGVALRLAQEIAYLYGEEDLWCSDELDEGKIQDQLILYCGVMLGATGAAQLVHVLAAELAKKALKDIPKKALMRTVYYPLVKAVAKAVGVKMTKEVFAKGVSKTVPVVGGVVSGGITLVSMRPMGMRLVNAFEYAHFKYTKEKLDMDLEEIVAVCENEEENDKD